MPKLDALAKAMRFAAQGKSIKDKAVLFNIGLFNQTARRPVLSIVRNSLRRLSRTHQDIIVRVCLSGGDYALSLRLDDRGDYQGIWECLGNMYRVPDRPISHVFDGGGNAGFFSLFAFARLAPSDIIVVEPDPQNLALLEKNLSGLGASVLPFALSGSDGDARFVRRGSNVGHLHSGDNCQGETYQLQTRRLSKLIPQDWDLRRTWLKLDIEGAEYEVLPEMLASGIRPGFISAEVHDYLGKPGEDLVNSLRQTGYEVLVDGTGKEGYVCRQIFAVHSTTLEKGRPEKLKVRRKAEHQSRDLAFINGR